MFCAPSQGSSLMKHTTRKNRRGFVPADRNVTVATTKFSWLPGASMAVLLAVFGVGMAEAAERRVAAGTVSVTKVVGELDVPWALAFLPDGGFLVTERSGRLLNFDSGLRRTEVSGVPDVLDKGQGGLLDIAVARDFSSSREIFLTFSKPYRNGRRGGTALASATLSDDNTRLSDVELLFEMGRPTTGGRHYGSRVVEAPDGSLFVTIGDRGKRDTAQDLSVHNGKIVRLGRDGSKPRDNPFVGVPDARSEIWSLGHRNPQSLALDDQGTIWAVEHGPMGGDEINRIGKGLNYGWPIIGYGRHYSGARIGVGHSKEGLEQPAFYWDPSIAPSGLMIYSGRLWPDWRGHFFVGSLKLDYVSRLKPGSRFTEEERLEFPETDRVRDVREAPDGSIWFLSEGHGAIFRIAPVP